MGAHVRIRAPRARHRRRAFTLLEIVVVVTILAIITAGVIPIFNGSLAATRTEHAVRDFHSFLQTAQSRAVSSGANHRVYIDTTARTYRLATFEGWDDGDPVFDNVAVEGRIEHRLPDALAFDRRSDLNRKRGSKTSYIEFYPNGACDPATIVVTVEGDRRRAYEIVTEATRVTMTLPEDS